jgi:hypothetical protein
MSNDSYPISKVYALLNKVLNTLVRRKFGKQYSIRLNSLRFISNRTNVYIYNACLERITINSLKPINMNELILIKEFLLFNLNSALMCIDNDSYMEVTEIELVII